LTGIIPPNCGGLPRSPHGEAVGLTLIKAGIVFLLGISLDSCRKTKRRLLYPLRDSKDALVFAAGQKK
jgi:hypothetical protein